MSLRFLLHNGGLIPILRPASAWALLQHCRGSFAEVLGGEMGPVRRDIVIPKRCTRWEALRTTPHHVQVQGLDVDDLTLIRFLRLNTFRCFEKRWQNIIDCSLETQEMCFKVYFISKESFSYHYLCDQIGRGDHGRRLWKECNTWTAIGVVFIFHHLKEALITPERSKENGQLLAVGSTVLPSWNVCLIIFDPPVT
ncbi:hypothetical protein HID58_043385 [Brassica napus]|uniref:Uncharacterized protein n=1 Tax=Brassica napus TaxID=3708 RepID=A0ABQ8BGD0_BRANA|nr:hypothetical protein HID58_043385 [Brassica napus]